MNRTNPWWAGVCVIGAVAAGCHSAPPPERAIVPEQAAPPSAVMSLNKPMPAPTVDDLPPPAFADEPIVSQEAPEAPAFVQSYNRVGRPRIVVFVNRTLQGEIMPVNPNDPAVQTENTRESSTGVTVDRSATAHVEGYYGRGDAEAHDKFQSTGPGTYKETSSLYLQPSQYDEVAAKSLDYEAIESVLMDNLSCDGQVVIESPTLARQKLTPEQVKDLESGQPQVSSEIVKQLGAEVLVQATAHPTRQTPQGLEVRLIVEAVNVRDGQSLGRVVVDVPPPLEKTTINRYTRFIARKLMRDMTGTWASPPPLTPRDAPSTPPAAPQMTPPTTEPAAAPSAAPRAFMSMPDSPAPAASATVSPAGTSATTGMPAPSPATQPSP